MRRSIAVVAVGVVLVALALAWTIGPLAGTLAPATLAERAVHLRDWPAAPLAVVAIFVVGNFVAVPASLMIAVTVLLFGPWRGVAYAYAGMLVGGSIFYAVVRFAAREPLERWLARQGDRRLAGFHRRVASHAFTAVALLRVTPLPYWMQNVALGAARIRYRDFLFGTALGLVPGMILLSGAATQLRAWIASPDLPHAALFLAAGVALVGGGWAIRLWMARRS